MSFFIQAGTSNTSSVAILPINHGSAMKSGLTGSLEYPLGSSSGVASDKTHDVQEAVFDGRAYPRSRIGDGCVRKSLIAKFQGHAQRC